MNSACIIAACAVNARKNCQEQKNSTQQGVMASEIYYKLRIRKYYNFDSITLVVPDGSYLTDLNPSIKALSLKAVHLSAKSFAREYSFVIPASKCTNSIDSYVKENLSKYTTPLIWYDIDCKIVDSYLTEIKDKHNISLTAESLKYTNQFFWEVDCV